jgi:hypothetical protein
MHPVKTIRDARVRKNVERVRALCMALPNVTEKLAWGEPTWRAPKIFAMLSTYHHGDDHVSVVVAAEPGVAGTLVASDPARFYVPPYVGGYGWVGIRIDVDPDFEELAVLLEDAHRLKAAPPKKKSAAKKKTERRVSASSGRTRSRRGP